MPVRTECKVCGKPFYAKNAKGMYCGNACRVKAHRLREKEKENQTIFIPKPNLEIVESLINKVNRLEQTTNSLYKDLKSIVPYVIQISELIGELPVIKEQVKENILEIRDLKNNADENKHALKNATNKNADNIRELSAAYGLMKERVNKQAGSGLNEVLLTLAENKEFIGALNGLIQTKE